jgi:hypothetical protein
MNRFDIFAIMISAALLFSHAKGLHAQDSPEVFADHLCSESSSPIMILGTYHMANPGLDAYNVEADEPAATPGCDRHLLTHGPGPKLV